MYKLVPLVKAGIRVYMFMSWGVQVFGFCDTLTNLRGFLE